MTKIGQRKVLIFLNDLAKGPDIAIRIYAQPTTFKFQWTTFWTGKFKATYEENKNDNITYLIGLLYRLIVIVCEVLSIP